MSTATRFRSVYFFDGTTGAPLTGLDLATLQADLSFTTRTGIARAKPAIIEIGGGGYGCTVSEEDEAEGVIIGFAGPSTSRTRFQLRTVARDRLLAWLYTTAAGDIYISGGVAAWGVCDDANGAPLSQPAITSFGAIYTTTIPPALVARGVSGRIDSPVDAFPEYLTVNVTPPWAPEPPAPVLYGQVFAADGKAVEGARDFAIDLSTGLFKRTSRGGVALTQGRDAIRQAVELSLSMVLGEYFLDTSIGFPLFERVLVKSPNLPALRDLYRQRIERVPGVVAVVDLTLDFDKRARTLKVTFRANTDLGEIDGSITR